MNVRPVSAARSAQYGADLQAAMREAQARMRHTITANLRAAGVGWDTQVADSSAALWDQDAWARAVETDVIPVATRIAQEINTLLRGRYKPVGMADPTPTLVQIVRQRALAGGPAIGRRLTMKGLTAAVDLEAVRAKIAAAPQRYGGVTHPDAQPTVADAYQQAFGVLDDLVANVGQHMSNAATSILGEAANQSQPNLVQHTWNCAMIETSREDHVDADGQTVDAGDSFDVGGESLMYPGDPSGSDEQTCNCLCWLTLEGVAADESAEDEEVA